jgi:hypothetical protein
MQADLPTTLEAWTTVGANIAVMAGALSVAIILQLNLHLSVRFQRDAARAQLLSVLIADTGMTMSQGTKDLLNTILYWSDNHKFSAGTASLSDEYREYVSRLVALFDLVLMDDNARAHPETSARIMAELSKHARALETAWPFRVFGLLPVSKQMQGVVRAVISNRA